MYEFEYMTKLTECLQVAYETNKETIKELAEVFAKNIMEDRIIHTFGTGHSHMIGIELFARAGGLGNVNAILDPDVITSNGAQRSCALEKLSGLADIVYDNYKIEAGDLMIISSNSGRNAMPIEMAMRCQKEGVIKRTWTGYPTAFEVLIDSEVIFNATILTIDDHTNKVVKITPVQKIFSL